MEGERDNQLIQRSNVIELNDENSVDNGKIVWYQVDSSGSGESENISNVAVTKKAECEQPPKSTLDLLKRLSGCVSQNKSVPAGECSKNLDNVNKENISTVVTSGTTRMMESSCLSGEQVCQIDVQDVQTANLPGEDGISPQRECPNNDSEVLRKAKEEGVVEVPFPGCVTKEACCKFVCEILKCILYQRQQLPMTYDQLNCYQKQQQASTQEGDIVGWRPPRARGGLDLRKCQRTLQELDELVGHLEVLFSLTLVPRVLLLLGGSPVMPKELYEINMEEVSLSTGDGCLRTSVCLRKIFRTLFVADILTDARPVHLLTTTVMAMGHRDCGVSGFRPKLDFKVPTRVKRQIIHIASNVNGVAQSNSIDWGDYVWFQAPVTIKGFCK